MRERDRRLGRALEGCLVVPPSPSTEAALRDLLERGALKELADLAYAHGIAAYLRAPLTDAGAPEVLIEKLDEASRRTALSHLAALADLGAFDALMADAAIPWLVVKGPVLAQKHPGTSWRPFSDVDVVVPKGHFAGAIRVLAEHGHEPEDADWAFMRRTVPGQLHVRLPWGTTADVHWHLINVRALRLQLAIDMEALFARARSTSLDGLTVRTLDTVDTMAHAALHASVGGANRLIWLKDIERCAEVEAPDWGELVGRAREWRTGPLVGVALERARRFLDAPIPPDVVDELLETTARRQFSRALDNRWPPVGPPQSVTPASIWAQVVRDDGLATGVALLRRLLRPLQTTGRRRGLRTCMPTLNRRASHRSTMAAYLQAVEAEASVDNPPERDNDLSRKRESR